MKKVNVKNAVVKGAQKVKSIENKTDKSCAFTFWIFIVGGLLGFIFLLMQADKQGMNISQYVQFLLERFM